MSYTVLTTKQTDAIRDKIVKVANLNTEILAIIDSAGEDAPAPKAVEAGKKPGRPRKVKVEAPASIGDLTA